MNNLIGVIGGLGPKATTYFMDLVIDNTVSENDQDNVVIQPLSKDRVERGDLDEYAIQKIAIKKSYSRISSTDIMKRIAQTLNITLDETPRRFKTKWDDKENILHIYTGKEK